MAVNLGGADYVVNVIFSEHKILAEMSLRYPVGGALMLTDRPRSNVTRIKCGSNNCLNIVGYYHLQMLI